MGRPPPATSRAPSATRLGHVRLDLRPVLGRDERAGLGRVVVAVAEADPLGTAGDLVHEAVVDSSSWTIARQPAEQTWPRWMNAAVSALSTTVSKSASAKTMLGLLPPSSIATFFMLTAAPRTRRPAGLDAAGQRDEVDVGAVGERLARPARRVQDEVHDPGRDAGLLQQPGQVDRRQRGRPGPAS